MKNGEIKMIVAYFHKAAWKKEKKPKLLPACWVQMNCYVIRQVSYLLFDLYTIILCVAESQEFTLAFFNLGKGEIVNPKERFSSWLGSACLEGDVYFVPESLLNVLSLRYKDNTSDPQSAEH